jgi:hypothetical protein
VFLLPSLFLGLIFALLLGGRPTRVLELRLRQSWAVFAALALQVVIFSPLGDGIPERVEDPLHLATYALLFVFAAANVRTYALLPLFLGMAGNAAAIAANGGVMPVSRKAWEAAGLGDLTHSNVAISDGHRLSFLGDVFALPSRFLLANVFSVGDVLIGAGMIALIVTVSTSDGSRRLLAPSRLLRPLADPSFRRLTAGRLVSHLGDWLTLAVLVGWIYRTTGSTAEVAVLMLVRMTPPIIGAGLAAAFVDRLPKERLLVWVEVARTVAVVAALAAVVAGARPLAFVAVGVLGALAAIAGATVRSLVPSLLGEEEYAAANAGLGIAQDAAMAAGAVGAGVALSAASTSFALACATLPFAAAVFLYAGVRVREGVAVTGEARRGALAGLRYLLGRRRLLTVVVAFASATLATGLTNATLPRFLDGDLHLGAGSYGFGLGALAAGLALGEATVGLARVGETGTRWIGAALLCMAGLFVLLGFTEHGPTALLFLGLIGFLDGTTDVLFDTFVQRETDAPYYGRVFGFASAFMMSTMMGAVAIAPLLNHIASPRVVILCAAASLVAAAAISLVGSRSRQEEPRVGTTFQRPAALAVATSEWGEGTWTARDLDA